jgi:hypothetical protein
MAYTVEHAPVALVQLPILDADPAMAGANVPLAAGYLKACAPLEWRESIRIPPRELANHGGDRLLLDWLLEQKPALAGFSCYLWNLERSLAMARRLKEALPGTRILFGGPEIVEGQPVLRSPVVDAFVLGEGETVFPALLEALRQPSPLPRRTQAPLADLAAVPNPYLTGTLEAGPEEPLYLETQRGCPQRCSYCFYGKQFPDLRLFPEPFLAEVFALARERQVPEIYLMDPSFTAAHGLQQRLRRIGELNPSGIPLHAELRLESVTPPVARLLARAGFRSVEAGLQSTNPQALRLIRRSFQREDFLRGAENLRAQGIAIRTGIILGLPGDSLETLAATLEFLRGAGLAEGAEVYPLALLPGTELRERAAELGLEFMGLPPYWVLRTDRLSEPDLFRAVRLCSDELGGELFPPILPRFQDPAPDITGFLDLRAGTPAAALHALTLLEQAASDPGALRLANSVTLLIGSAQLDNAAALADLLMLGSRLRETNPFSLCQLVLEGPEVPSPERAERLAEAFCNPKHFFNRSRYYHEDLQNRFSARLFHLTSDLATARRYLDEPLAFDLILSYTPQLLDHGRDLLEERPLLAVRRPISAEEERKLRALYHDWPNLLLFID